MAESPRRKRFLFRTFLLGMLGLILVSGVVLVANAIGWFGPTQEGDPEIRAQISAAEGLSLSKLGPDWTVACIATSYCTAKDLPDLPANLAAEICGNFPDDNIWGIAFLKDGKLLSVRDMSSAGDFAGRPGCLERNASPRLILDVDGGIRIKSP